jgi:hypothetical protein
LFALLGSENQRRTIAGAVERINLLLSAEGTLVQYSSDVATMVAMGSAHLRAASDDLAKARIETGHVDELSQIEENEVSALQQLAIAERITKNALGLTGSDVLLDAVGAAPVGITAAQSLAPNRRQYRLAGVLDQANAETLRSGAKRRDKLVATRASLDKQLEIRLLPSADELQQVPSP